jgi:hypothetical protein
MAPRSHTTPHRRGPGQEDVAMDRADKKSEQMPPPQKRAPRSEQEPRENVRRRASESEEFNPTSQGDEGGEVQ